MAGADQTERKGVVLEANANRGTGGTHNYPVIAQKGYHYAKTMVGEELDRMQWLNWTLGTDSGQVRRPLKPAWNQSRGHLGRIRRIFRKHRMGGDAE